MAQGRAKWPNRGRIPQSGALGRVSSVGRVRIVWVRRPAVWTMASASVAGGQCAPSIACRTRRPARRRRAWRGRRGRRSTRPRVCAWPLPCPPRRGYGRRTRALGSARSSRARNARPVVRVSQERDSPLLARQECPIAAEAVTAASAPAPRARSAPCVGAHHVRPRPGPRTVHPRPRTVRPRPRAARPRPRAVRPGTRPNTFV
ncbi:hypothetical protein HMPREF9005_1814 [Actinomyces sp. oral taxon 178 str. F0338]|nr:hypothetical protein HMPREF9005_1814 [Actinomyces sp. oral taxon 178 str. F0338]